MIHELQTIAIVLAILGALAGLLYRVISLARQVRLHVVFEQVWNYLFLASVVMFLAYFALQLAWVVIGQIIDEFIRSHFTQEFFYNFILNGMQYIFKVSGSLMLILFLSEKGYVYGLKPLLKKVKAATKL